jgi:hypothetical protein
MINAHNAYLGLDHILYYRWHRLPVMLPKRKRDAADRKRLFAERQQKDGER